MGTNNIKQRYQRAQRNTAPTQQVQPQPTQQVQQTNQLPPTPSQVIQGGLVMQQQKQLMKKQQAMMIAQQMYEQMYMTPAKMMFSQRAQMADQQYMLKKQIDFQRDNAEMSAIMPRQTVQDSEQVIDIDPNRMAVLEQLYANTNGAPLPNMQPGFTSGSPYLYETPLRSYQGGFMNPNIDKQQRPLGDETSSVASI